MREVLAIVKVMMFVVISIVFVPMQLIVLSVGRGAGAYILPQLWHKILCVIFGIKVKCFGEVYTTGHTIYVSNHMSYLDILVLGTLLRASFVSKKDVASWPLLGFLSRLQQTAFISRSHVDAKREKNALDSMLIEGKNLIIFPEGTSTDGRVVIPFKSSLFSIAVKDNNDIKVQPVTLALKSVEGHSVKVQDDYDLYAWHINMITPLGEHLWRFLRSKGAEIHVYFHSVVDAREYSDRKILARLCYETVSNGLANHKIQNENC